MLVELTLAMERSQSSNVCACWMQVSCGARHTVVLTKSGQLFSWGLNMFGQLGHSDRHTRDAPREVHLPKALRDALAAQPHGAAADQAEPSGTTQSTGQTQLLCFGWTTTICAELVQRKLKGWDAYTQESLDRVAGLID